ncbi:MAG: hypothetical protein CVV13_03725 [Gammaproteobacteria bacterium HGW-Gammaproteobacteria-3]|nr:MAG: hypothetical protein CVV13_03725 [Gammaproteobacteria bacterium HGW-Gammaproteobacteria-3]
MIALEIVVTLVAALTTLVFTILIIESNALRRTRLKHCLEEFDLMKHQTPDKTLFDNLKQAKFDLFTVERKRSFIYSFRFIIQVLFGLAVFIGFAGWAYYLFKQQFIEWAFVSAIFSLLGMVMPAVIWRGFKRRDEDIDRLFRGLAHYEQAFQTAEKSVSATTLTPTKAAPSADKKAALPEDSVLRRHYLTQLAAEKAALTNPYPTDSVLKRHYDARVKALLEIPKTPAERNTIAEAKPASVVQIETPGKIPQDSVLRRHYLTHLRSKIEAEFYPRPTDSVLRRHYDSFIKTELEKRLRLKAS